MTYDLAWKVVLREAKIFLIRYLKIDVEKEDYETRVREELEIVEFEFIQLILYRLFCFKTQ